MKSPLIAVLAVLAALYFTSIDHGLPHRYVPDDHAVRAALGIARDLGNPELPKLMALVPPAGQYTTYPYLLVYADLAAIATSYAAGRLTGAWHGAGEFSEVVFDNPTVAWLPARLVTALLSLLVPLGTWLAARELGRSPRAAVLAALLAGSSLLIVQFAKTERPWAPLVGFTALALAFSLRLVRRGDLRSALAAAGSAALAAACHPLGLAVFALPAAAALLGRVAWRRVLAGVLLGASLALLVGYPYLLVYRQDSGQGVISGQLGEDSALEIGGQAFDFSRFAGQHALRVGSAWLGYDPVLIVAGLIGLLLLLRGTARRSVERRAALLVTIPPVLLAVLFLAYDGSHVRYLMPTVPFLALGAATALARLVARGGLAVGLALLCVSLPVIQSVRLVRLLSAEDTRTEAARRVAEWSEPAQVVAVDGYEPPLVARAASVRRLESEVWVSRAERRIVEFSEAGVPEPEHARSILPVTRYYRYQSCYATDYVAGNAPRELGELFDEWDVARYVQVDRLPRFEPRAPVEALTAARGRLLLELSPTGAGNPPEAALPTEMSFALLDLWRYERPGPWIRIWEIGDAPR